MLVRGAQLAHSGSDVLGNFRVGSAQVQIKRHLSWQRWLQVNTKTQKQQVKCLRIIKKYNHSDLQGTWHI